MKIIDAVKSRLTTKRDLSTRLWRAGGLLAVFMWTMFVAKCVSGNDRTTWNKLGHDFLAFYYGGNCARTGHYEQLYDLSAARAFEQKIGHAAGPFDWHQLRTLVEPAVCRLAVRACCRLCPISRRCTSGGPSA